MSDFYNNIGELIQDLLDGKVGDSQEINLTPNDFDNEDLHEFRNDFQKFWKEFLAFMNNHEGTTEMELSYDNENQKESVGYYINRLADFMVQNQEKYSNLFNAITNKIKGAGQGENGSNIDSGIIDLEQPSGVQKDKDYFWNESMNKAIAKFLYYFDPKEIKKYEQKENEAYKDGTKDFDRNNTDITVELNHGIPVGGTIKNFHLSDIVNADAGLNLKDDGSVDPTRPPWVRPQYNIDGKLYKYVRGVDKILSVLNSNDEMQFTETQGTEDEPHWLRLLMPKYMRYVEVEDLNRNFWVIGQVITAICSFIFEEDGPLNQLLKDILDELPQLWENVFYLWLTAAALSQKPKYTTVHVEEVFLPNSPTQPYLKFDNFANAKGIQYSEQDESIITDTNINYEQIKNSLQYLISQYPKDNLCIIPKIRYNNYKKNYYSGILVPALYFYDRNLDSFYHIPFDKAINIDLRDSQIQERLYGICEEEDKYSYYYPLYEDMEDDEERVFYGLAELKIHLNSDYDLEQNKFFINGYINLYDRSNYVLFGEIKAIPFVIAIASRWIDVYSDVIRTSSIVDFKDFEDQTPSIDITQTEIQRGYYQGELLSYWHFVELIKYVFQNSSIDVLPYFIPSAITFNEENGKIEKRTTSNIDAQVFDILKEMYGYTEPATIELYNKIKTSYEILSKAYFPYAMKCLSDFFLYENKNGQDVRDCYSKWQQTSEENKAWTGMNNYEWLKFVINNNDLEDDTEAPVQASHAYVELNNEYSAFDSKQFNYTYNIHLVNNSVKNGRGELKTFVNILSEIGLLFQTDEELKTSLEQTGDTNNRNNLDLMNNGDKFPYIKIIINLKPSEQLTSDEYNIEIQLRYNSINKIKDIDTDTEPFEKVGIYLLRQHLLYKALLVIGCQEAQNSQKIIEDYVSSSYMTVGKSYHYFTEAEIERQQRYYKAYGVDIGFINDNGEIDQTCFVPSEVSGDYILTMKGYDKICCVNKLIRLQGELSNSSGTGRYKNFYQCEAYRVAEGGGIGWDMFGSSCCLLEQTGSGSPYYGNKEIPLVGSYNQSAFGSSMCVLTPVFKDENDEDIGRNIIYYDGCLIYNRANEANNDEEFIHRNGGTNTYINIYNYTQSPIVRGEDGKLTRGTTGEAGTSQWLVMTRNGEPLNKDNWLLVGIKCTHSNDAKLIGSYTKRTSNNSTTNDTTYYNAQYILFDLLETSNVTTSNNNPILIKEYLEQLKDIYGFNQNDIDNQDYVAINNHLKTNNYMYFGADTSRNSDRNIQHRGIDDDIVVWLGMAGYLQNNSDTSLYVGYDESTGDYSFITGYYIIDQEVCIFTPDGSYSITYYVRDTNPASSKYLQWEKYKTVHYDSSTKTVDQVEISRDGYVVITNDKPGKDFEQYKSRLSPELGVGIIHKYDGNTFTSYEDDNTYTPISWSVW